MRARNWPPLCDRRADYLPAGEARVAPFRPSRNRRPPVPCGAFSQQAEKDNKVVKLAARQNSSAGRNMARAQRLLERGPHCVRPASERDASHPLEGDRVANIRAHSSGSSSGEPDEWAAVAPASNLPGERPCQRPATGGRYRFLRLDIMALLGVAKVCIVVPLLALEGRVLLLGRRLSRCCGLECDIWRRLFMLAGQLIYFSSHASRSVLAPAC